MTEIYILADNISTPLGFSTNENAGSLLAGKTGICLHENESIAPLPFYASLVDTKLLNERFSSLGIRGFFTRFEMMAACSVSEAISKTGVDLSGGRTLFILSTTKGNIDLLSKNSGNINLYLWHTARKLKDCFNFANEPMVISDACISGVQAIITAARLIRAGLYDNAVINGTDIISEFVYSGFSSFKSLSTGPCRPFDRTRDGLSLGEGSGTIILSAEPEDGSTVQVTAGEGFSTNDANHISGPSRTGEGLFQAINSVQERNSREIGFISAHGTGTLYNDEMESVALTRAGLQNVPVNSLKGYWGHTLGAAGVIESIMSIWSMKNGIFPATLGFSEPGVTNPLNIISSPMKGKITNCLKIASGFGGCNAAITFSVR